MKTIDKFLLTTLIVGMGALFVGEAVKNKYIYSIGAAMFTASVTTRVIDVSLPYRRRKDKEDYR